MALRSSNPIDRIRENYRRQEARSPRTPVEPTPERQAKAAGIGYKTVGRRAPGEISQRRADAQRRWTALEREIPPEMWEVFQQLVGEETGQLEGRPQSLARFGHQHGWNQDRQAVAAGGMLAISAMAVVHHALKRGILEVIKGAGAPNLRYTEINGSRK